MLNTRNVDPGNRSIPYGMAWALAVGAEWVWRTFGLKGEPIVTRTTVKLMGEEVTVNDAKARCELVYQGKMTIAQGLAEMKN